MKRIWQQELTIAIYILIGCMFSIAMFILESKFFGFVGLGFLLVAIGCKRKAKQLHEEIKVVDINVQEICDEVDAIAVTIKTKPEPEFSKHQFLQTPNGLYKKATEFQLVALYRKDTD